MRLRPLSFVVAAMAAVVGLSRWHGRRGGGGGGGGDADNATATPVSQTAPLRAAEQYRSPVGLTVFPGRIESPTQLVVIAPARIFESPDTASNVVSEHAVGDTVVATGERHDTAERWFETAGGFLPSSVVDVLAAEIDGDLPVGTEGLVGGVAMPWQYEPADLVEVPDPMRAPGVHNSNLRLRTGALTAFEGLIEAAEREGFEVRVLSAFRSGSYQATLYASQIESKGLFQNVSAPPGRSEHQLGTTADLFVRGAAPLDVSLGQTPAGIWLAEHAGEYGLELTFSQSRHEARGVAYEPWHLRWVGGQSNEQLW